MSQKKNAEDENDTSHNLSKHAFQSVMLRSNKRHLEEEIGLDKSIFKKSATAAGVLHERNENISLLVGNKQVTNFPSTLSPQKTMISVNNTVNSATPTRLSLPPESSILSVVTPPATDISQSENINLATSDSFSTVNASAIDLSIPSHVKNSLTSVENNNLAKSTPRPPSTSMTLIPFTSLLTDDSPQYSTLFSEQNSTCLKPSQVPLTEFLPDTCMVPGTDYSLLELTNSSGMNIVEKPRNDNSLFAANKWQSASLTRESSSASGQEFISNVSLTAENSKRIDNIIDTDSTTSNYDEQTVEDGDGEIATSSHQSRAALLHNSQMDQDKNESVDNGVFQAAMAPHFDGIIAAMSVGKSKVLTLYSLSI